jgi:hypothetical protein
LNMQQERVEVRDQKREGGCLKCAAREGASEGRKEEGWECVEHAEKEECFERGSERRLECVEDVAREGENKRRTKRGA